MKFREMVRDEVEDRNKGYFKLYRYIEFWFLTWKR
jgi:hypothetical protein